MKPVNRELLNKYDIPSPRYTSYPTVPYWTESPTTEQWFGEVNTKMNQGIAPWSLYIHIPYCESLCTYCGCNNTITRNHDKENPYVDNILKEWQIYLDAVPALKEQPLRQIHLGGGTPTFLSAENLHRLIAPMIETHKIEREHFEGSIEVDPRRTNREHLQVLAELGFRRISLGVQDFDSDVQRLVNRIQPYEMTKSITDQARELGYDSVNYDLIYGLPKQSPESVKRMAEHTLELRPDRIALYSLAIVPWIKPQQRSFKEEDLPKGSEKRDLYEIARNILLDGGYLEIGMDHFALPSDALAVAQSNKNMHRNFMGYTDQRTDVMIGLGVSSISEAPGCFHQNEKVLPVYERELDKGNLPTLRGHLLTDTDRKHREQILEFMTNYEVALVDQQQEEDVSNILSELMNDDLVIVKDQKLKLTDKGRPFLRNACMALDERMRESKPETKVFSQSM